MSINNNLFSIIEGQLTYQSAVPIKSMLYVQVYISTNGLTNSYTLVPTSAYSVINDAVVFNVAPTGLFLRIVVGTTRGDLLDSPSNTALVASYMPEIKTVADNIDAILNNDLFFTVLTPEFKSVDFDVFNQYNYIVDTTLGTIIVNVPVGVESFTLTDFDLTWSDINKVQVVLGTDIIELGSDNSGRKYLFVKYNNTFRCYSATGEFLAEGNI